MTIISWDTFGDASVFGISRDDCQKLRGRIEYLVCTLEFYKSRDREMYLLYRSFLENAVNIHFSERN